MDDFPGNRHSETEKMQCFYKKDVNFLKMWIASVMPLQLLLRFIFAGNKDYQAKGTHASKQVQGCGS